MTYKEKIIELFKTVSEIKSDLEELRFWTTLTFRNHWHICKYICTQEWNKITSLNDRNVKVWRLTEHIKEIIWNPLEERHLRMYLEKLDWDFVKQRMNWDYEWIPQWEWEVNDVLFSLDNNKSFDNQSEEFREELYNFLTKI